MASQASASRSLCGGRCSLVESRAKWNALSGNAERAFVGTPLVTGHVLRPSLKSGSHGVCRAQAKLVKSKAGGFSSTKAPAKKPHKIEKLEVNKVGAVEAFQVFARLERFKEDDERFKPIAELLVAEGSDVAKAIKERRRQLVELAKESPEFVNSPDNEIQYAFQKSPKKDERHDFKPTVISVGGPIDYESVPAILRSAANAGLKLFQPREGNFA